MSNQLCKGASHFHMGLKGKNADITKLLFVLHRSDHDANGFFDGWEGALKNRATGIILDNMLKYCGLSLEDICITNIFKCLLPNDNRPSKQQYQNCLKVFKQQVELFEPKAIISFGNQAYNLLFPEQAKEHALSKEISYILKYNNIPSLTMIHLSQIWKKFNFEKKEPYFKALKEFLGKYKNS